MPIAPCKITKANMLSQQSFVLQNRKCEQGIRQDTIAHWKPYEPLKVEERRMTCFKVDGLFILN